jgi:hypothetical protein
VFDSHSPFPSIQLTLQALDRSDRVMEAKPVSVISSLLLVPQSSQRKRLRFASKSGGLRLYQVQTRFAQQVSIFPVVGQYMVCIARSRSASGRLILSTGHAARLTLRSRYLVFYSAFSRLGFIAWS